MQALRQCFLAVRVKRLDSTTVLGRIALQGTAEGIFVRTCLSWPAPVRLRRIDMSEPTQAAARCLYENVVEYHVRDFDRAQDTQRPGSPGLWVTVRRDARGAQGMPLAEMGPLPAATLTRPGTLSCCDMRDSMS